MAAMPLFMSAAPRPYIRAVNYLGAPGIVGPVMLRCCGDHIHMPVEDQGSSATGASPRGSDVGASLVGPLHRGVTFHSGDLGVVYLPHVRFESHTAQLIRDEPLNSGFVAERARPPDQPLQEAGFLLPVALYPL